MTNELIAEFTEDGYPTNECWESIRRYHDLPEPLLRFLCTIWREPGYAREVTPGEFVFWTGCDQNDVLLEALRASPTWPLASWNHIAMSGFLWIAWAPRSRRALESLREAQQIVWRLAWRDDSKYPWRAGPR